MARFSTMQVITILSAFIGLCTAQQECPLQSPGTGLPPVTAAGIDARVISASQTTPRDMVLDSAGHVLVVNRGIGIVALTLTDYGGACVGVNSSKVVVSDNKLNHGVEVIGTNLLLASDTDKVYIWNYDPQTASVTGARRTVIQGMYNTDHATRTITKSTKKPGTIIVNRGSQSNIDLLALDKSSGHAQIRAFDLNALKAGAQPYTWTDGLLLGWGMRNNVGIAEHPQTGGIYSVENSVDNIERAGVQFNQQNPAEKLQYLGSLVNNTSTSQGSNFGYPYCYAAWAAGDVPDPPSGLVTGQQFSINRTYISDKGCRARVAPSLVFDAHMAPLDIKFHPKGQAGYISFHGSFDRPTPAGYKISKILMNEGKPVAAPSSQTAAIDLVTNQSPGSCPTGCFRPAGIVLLPKNRLLFSSDATGEIYVVARSNGRPL